MKPSTKKLTLSLLVITLIFIAIDALSNTLLLKVFPDSVLLSDLSTLLIVVPLLLAYPLYKYLRRDKVGSRSEVQTALVLAISSIPASLVLLFVTLPLLGENTSDYGVVAMTITNAIFAFILGVAGAAIARKIYDRRHSIITE